ncbi:MAG: response regulator [Granulosicoccus sp.]|nr:response regulator [Granulosicoccus sp.]
MNASNAVQPLDDASENEFVFVDDDKLTIEIVSWIVRKTEHRSTLFMDAREALAYLKKSPPRLLIVDYYMPGMTGLEFLNELNDATDLSHTRVFLCSAVNPSRANNTQFAAMNVGIIEKQLVCDKVRLINLLDEHLEAESHLNQ